MFVIVFRYSERVQLARSTYVSLAVSAGMLVAWWVYLAQFDFHTWNDENIHLYVAKAVSDGAALYREVPSARPPLGILVLALLDGIGLSPVAAARVGVAVAMTGLVGVLWAAVHRHAGALAAAIAVAAFLLSPDASSQLTYTIIHWVALGALVTTVLVLENAFVAAGVAAGVALGFGQHAFVVVALAGGYALWRGKLRAAARYGAGLALSFGAVALVGLALGGRHFIDDVFVKHLYHLGGGAEAEDGQLGWWLRVFLSGNAGSIVLAIGAAVLARRKTLPATASADALAIPPLFGAVHLLTVFTMSGGLYLYFYPAYALLAWGAGTAIARAMSRSSGDVSLGRVWFGSGAVALLAWIAGWTYAQQAFVARDARSGGTTYSWFAPVRTLQMAHVQRMSVAEEIAASIANDGGPTNGTVFGEPPLASLVALYSGRRFAGHLADLAPRWIRQGSVTRQSIIDRIEGDHVEYFVTPRWFYTRDAFFRRYLQDAYEAPAVHERQTGDGGGIPAILVFRRKTNGL